MTEATLTPAAALAERVLEATHSAGQVDVAPGRKAAALTALDQLGYPTTRDERWKYTRVARIQQWAPQATDRGQVQPPEVLPALDAHRLTFVDGCFLNGKTTDEQRTFIGPCPPHCPPIQTGFLPSNTTVSQTTNGSPPCKRLLLRMGEPCSSPTG